MKRNLFCSNDHGWKFAVTGVAALAFVLACVVWAPCAIPVSAQAKKPPTVGLNDLIEHADVYENKVILLKGEAIGDILNRGDYAWVNVSDGNNSAIGVWLPAKMAKQISVLGRYGVLGDELLITGTYHRACREHGGDLDIHADSMQILSKGKADVPEIPAWLPYLAGGSAGCAIILSAFAFRRIRCYNRGKTDQKKDGFHEI